MKTDNSQYVKEWKDSNEMTKQTEEYRLIVKRWEKVFAFNEHLTKKLKHFRTCYEAGASAIVEENLSGVHSATDYITAALGDVLLFADYFLTKAPLTGERPMKADKVRKAAKEKELGEGPVEGPVRDYMPAAKKGFIKSVKRSTDVFELNTFLGFVLRYYRRYCAYATTAIVEGDSSALRSATLSLEADFADVFYWTDYYLRGGKDD